MSREVAASLRVAQNRKTRSAPLSSLVRDKLVKRQTTATFRNSWHTMRYWPAGGNLATTQDDMIAELQRANAALRLQLDQRGAERDAALAREAALAEVLDIINRSPGNLGKRCEADTLRRSARVCWT